MGWRLGIIPIIYTCIQIVAIALAAILIDNILSLNNSSDSLWLISGIILAFLISGTIFSTYSTVLACMRDETILTETLPVVGTKLVDKNCCEEWFYIFVHISLSTIIVAFSSIIIAHPQEVNYSSYVFAGCILALSVLSLSVLIGVIIWKMVNCCLRGRVTLRRNTITVHI